MGGIFLFSVLLCFLVRIDSGLDHSCSIGLTPSYPTLHGECCDLGKP